jgi:hypothetical protein
VIQNRKNPNDSHSFIESLKVPKAPSKVSQIDDLLEVCSKIDIHSSDACGNHHDTSAQDEMYFSYMGKKVTVNTALAVAHAPKIIQLVNSMDSLSLLIDVFHLYDLAHLFNENASNQTLSNSALNRALRVIAVCKASEYWSTLSTAASNPMQNNYKPFQAGAGNLYVAPHPIEHS